MNITEPIRRNARLFPESVAIIAGGHEVSYAELDRLIDASATRVLAVGLRPGATAAVLVSDRYRHFVLVLALARLGIAAVVSSHVAANPGKTKIQCGFVDAGKGNASIVITNAWWRDMTAATPAGNVEPNRNDDAVCLIGASSGTTGTPKAMALTHAQLCRRLYARQLSMFWPTRPRVACTLGRESVYGFSTLFRTLWMGGLLAFPGDSVGIPDLVRQHQVNCLVMSPAQLQEVVDSMPEGTGPLPSLEMVELGGGMLPGQLAGSARTRLCPNIFINYGAQESGSVASAPMTVLETQAGSVGYLGPGVEVQAVDAEHRPLAAGVEGVLRIRSPGSIESYLDDPIGSAKAFEDGWFYPGDIGTVSSRGLLILSGRSDELLNAGGVKVSPAVIEEAARAFADVADAAAFAAPDAKSGLPQIWLAVVQRKPVDVSALIKHCVRELGVPRSPRAVLLLKSLPRNDNGKLQRDQLVKMATAAKSAPAAKAPTP
jgi:acyl-CoA synthetase (AMP-forming)/AMP-acid ligase II